MASVSLKRSYLHLAADPADYVRFPEKRVSDNRGTRSAVQDYSDDTRKVVASPVQDLGVSIRLPQVTRDIVEGLREYRDQVVLFRSPTGEYLYGQVLRVMTDFDSRRSDRYVSSATIVLDPVDYGGLI